MKIGIDVRLWNETGVGRYIRNLVGELQKLDKKNEYVLFAYHKDYDQIKLSIFNPDPIGVNFQFSIVRADFRWHSIEEQLRFPALLNRHNLDLVHFPYFSIPIFYNRSFVVTIHDLILNNYPTGQASTLPFPVYWLKHLGYRYIISQAAKNAKKIIVPSNATKEEVIKRLGVSENKIAVTAEGVDDFIENSKLKTTTQNSKPQLKTQNFFLYVGNAYPHKNLERVLDAFKTVNSQLSRLQKSGTGEQATVNFIFVGKEDYFYNRLKHKVRNLGLQENVIFLHDINDQELAYLYRNAICLVAPSLMEGFGLTVLEAMVSGCMVIASEISSFKEVAKDTILYFNPKSIDDMKQKMFEILHMDVKKKERMIKEAKNRSSEFSWKKMVKETLKVYTALRQAQGKLF